MSLVVIVLVVVILAAAVCVLLERCLVRRTGMSAATPVCGSCHYQLGGWSSPKCPECGADVRKKRVRVGARTVVPISILLSFLMIVVVCPAVWIGVDWLLLTRHWSGNAYYRSGSIRRFAIEIQARCELQRFPRSFEYDLVLWLARFDEETPESDWSAMFPTPVIIVSEATGGPARADLDVAIRAFVGTDVDDTVMAKNVTAIDALCSRVIEAQRGGRPVSGVFSVPSGGPLQNVMTSGGASWRSTRWRGLAPLAAIVAMVLSIWCSVKIARRLSVKASRPPADGEWTRAQAST